MTSNEARAKTLVRALRAGIEGDRQELRAVFTEDVRAWTPAMSAASLSELMDDLERRDDAFTDMVLDVTPLDVGGDHACAEWTVDMTHSGRITLADQHTIEPSGIRVTLRGVTIAEFQGDQICSLRQYWDEFAVLEQLGVMTSSE